MARRRRNAPLTTVQIVTPAHGVTKELEPLMFGNFLPQKFQSTEVLHADGDMNDLPPSMNEVPTNLAVRRLQFSDASGSEKSIPTAAEVVRGNRNAQMGKPLLFVPPTDRDGKKVIKTSEEDLKPQVGLLE